MIYLSYYFTNLPKVHPGPYTCAYILDILHILSCSLQRDHFWGWRQVGFNLLFYLLLCPARLASAHRCVYFYKVCDPTPQIFGFFLKISSMLLRVYLLIVLCPTFFRRIQTCRRVWWQFPRNMDWILLLILLDVSAIVSRLICPPDHYCLAELLWDSSCTLVPLCKGLQRFWW